MDRTLLLKPDEVAEQLRVARASVYRLIAAGDLPSVKVGKSIRISSDALREWIATKTKEIGR
jgi:excisionase family DNA binding protein